MITSASRQHTAPRVVTMGSQKNHINGGLDPVGQTGVVAKHGSKPTHGVPHPVAGEFGAFDVKRMALANIRLRIKAPSTV